MKLSIFNKKICEVVTKNGRFYSGKLLEITNTYVIVDDIKKGYTVIYEPECVFIAGRMKIVDILNKLSGWENEQKKPAEKEMLKKVESELHDRRVSENRPDKQVQK